MATYRVAFTKSALNCIQHPVSGKRDHYRDDGGINSNRYLVLQITATAKTFYFTRWVQGRGTTRHRIGEWPAISIDKARKRCTQLSADVDQGVDPMAEKRRQRQTGISLTAAFEQYIEDATHRAVDPLTQATVGNYRRSIKSHFKAWLSKPAKDVTSQMVEDWYRQATKESISSANSAMRAARAVYNYQKKIATRQQSELFKYNPFAGHTMAREAARDECIETSELPQWVKAVEALQSETTRDYLLLMLYTGLRRREAAPLRWSDIDFKKKSLTAKGATETGKTKSGTTHTIPLSTFLIALLERRRPLANDPKGYVFPGTGKVGYLSDPKKAINSIESNSGIRCSCHGLRRTFSNFAAFEAEIPELARKRLLNHKIDQNDVTAKHYSKLTMERLRRYQQAVTDSILYATDATRPIAEVVKLEVVS
jgi:integrase